MLHVNDIYTFLYKHLYKLYYKRYPQIMISANKDNATRK